MEKRINFQDNLFILNIRIRMIHDMFILEADGDLFLDTSLNDLRFIHRTLIILMKELSGRQLLIDRDELFRDFVETERRFSEILTDFSRWARNIAETRAADIDAELERLRTESLERLQKTENAAAELAHSPQDSRVVSSAELGELLKGMDSE
jgi:hypothetical protein